MSDVGERANGVTIPSDQMPIISQPGTAPSTENEPPLPDLRFHDQTPLSKPDNKRSRLLLGSSPTEEDNSDDARIQKFVDEAIQRTISSMLPKIVETLRTEIKDTLSNAITKAVSDMKTEIMGELREDIVFVDKKSELKTLCETEQLETYNRRDNLKILGINENLHEDGHLETPSETIEKVLNVSNIIESKVTANDISIAHRLGTKSTARPIIVNFSRRIAKVNMLTNKKLKDNPLANNVRIIEDISRSRVKFLNLMRTDPRNASAWTKEGTVFFTEPNSQQINKFNNLYDGGILLNYSLDDVLYCFRNN